MGRGASAPGIAEGGPRVEAGPVGGGRGVADGAGRERVVTRFGDRVWDLTSEVEAKNRQG